MNISQERLKAAKNEHEALTICNEVRVQKCILLFAKQYAFSSDYKIARNALWILTKATDDELSALQNMLTELINQALTTQNSAVCRLSLTIINRLTITKENLRTDFLDFCLQRMTSLTEYPGIQSVCMKLAFKMCSFYPELTDEFMRTISAMEFEYYTPAVKSVRNKILNRK